MREIFVDGACCDETGRGGIGIVSESFCQGKSFFNTTAFDMEIQAVIHGVRLLNNAGGIVYTDAQYVVRHMKKFMPRWKKRGFPKESDMKNKLAWLELFLLLNNGTRLQYIRKDRKNPLHVLAHQLAREAMNNAVGAIAPLPQALKSISVGAFNDKSAGIGMAVLITNSTPRTFLFHDIDDARLHLMAVFEGLKFIQETGTPVLKIPWLGIIDLMERKLPQWQKRIRAGNPLSEWDTVSNWDLWNAIAENKPDNARCEFLLKSSLKKRQKHPDRIARDTLQRHMFLNGGEPWKNPIENGNSLLCHEIPRELE